MIHKYKRLSVVLLVLVTVVLLAGCFGPKNSSRTLRVTWENLNLPADAEPLLVFSTLQTSSVPSGVVVAPEGSGYEVGYAKAPHDWSRSQVTAEVIGDPQPTSFEFSVVPFGSPWEQTAPNVIVLDNNFAHEGVVTVASNGLVKEVPFLIRTSGGITNMNCDVEPRPTQCGHEGHPWMLHGFTFSTGNPVQTGGDMRYDLGGDTLEFPYGYAKYPREGFLENFNRIVDISGVTEWSTQGEPLDSHSIYLVRTGDGGYAKVVSTSAHHSPHKHLMFIYEYSEDGTFQAY